MDLNYDQFGCLGSVSVMQENILKLIPGFPFTLVDRWRYNGEINTNFTLRNINNTGNPSAVYQEFCIDAIDSL